MPQHQTLVYQEMCGTEESEVTIDNLFSEMKKNNRVHHPARQIFESSVL